MKYLLFAYYGYEAGGGWNDFIDSFDTVEDAKRAFETNLCDGAHNAHIVEASSRKYKMIWDYGRWGREKTDHWKEVKPE